MAQSAGHVAASQEELRVSQWAVDFGSVRPPGTLEHVGQFQHAGAGVDWDEDGAAAADAEPNHVDELFVTLDTTTGRCVLVSAAAATDEGGRLSEVLDNFCAATSGTS
jgi:hypothetical protein